MEKFRLILALACIFGYVNCRNATSEDVDHEFRMRSRELSKSNLHLIPIRKTPVKPIPYPRIIELQPHVHEVPTTSQPIVEDKTKDIIYNKKNYESSLLIKKDPFKNKQTPPPSGDVFVKRKSMLLSLDKVSKRPPKVNIKSTPKPLVEYANLAKIPLLEIRRTTLKNETDMKQNETSTKSNVPVQTTEPFSYKFVPQQNPTRINEENLNETTESYPKHNHFMNFNELPYVKSKDTYYNGDLQTSESRQRSKIEIKEVNGTLYEYEYIYYYDDEYPQYDYDVPIVDEVNPQNNLVSNKDTISKTTKRPSGRTSVNNNRGQQVGVRNNQINEIVPQTESPALGRQPARQSSRGRALSKDGAVENLIPASNIDTFILPAQTRFPPRDVTTPETLPTQKTLSLSNNEIKIGAPVINNFFNEPEQTTVSDIFLTTDNAANNLYALSRAVDSNYTEVTTVDTTEPETIKSFDYSSLYDYDLTLSELDNLDFGTTTTINDIFTTVPTTTVTTTTTTTPAPTTTKKQRGRNSRFGGASRLSRLRGGSRGKKPQKENEIQPEVTTESTSSAPVPSNNSRRRFQRPSIRGRLNHRGKQQQEKEVKEEVEEVVETSSTTAAPSRSQFSRNRFARPRSNVRGRLNSRNNQNKEQSTTTKPTEETEVTTQIVEATTKSSRRLSGSRFRRPSSRNNLLGKFSRNRKTKTIEPEESEVQEQDSTAITTTALPVETENVEAPKSKGKSRRPHRFNLSNRRSRNRFGGRKTATETDVATDAPVAEVLTIETPQETTTTTARPSRGFRRNNGASRSRSNIHSRFRVRKPKNTDISETNEPQEVSTASEPEVNVQIEAQITEEPQIAPKPRIRGRNPLFRGRERSNRRNLPPSFNRSRDPVNADAEEPQEEVAPKIIEEAPTTEIIEETPSSEPEPQPEPVPEEGTDKETTEPTPAETTTAKLTRRQILAQRRASFLTSG